MRLIKILAIGLAALTFHSNAAITDNESNLENSFKDTDTDLVWMDFGVNNHLTYEQVISMLGSGGDYEGWRLPTSEEVYILISNIIAIDDDSSNTNLEHNYIFANATNSPTSGSDDTVFEDTFDTVGHNVGQSSGVNWTGTGSRGLYAGTDGLSIVEFLDRKVERDGVFVHDSIKLDDRDNFDGLKDDQNLLYSTLLISAPVTSVSEPGTFTMLTLALLGLSVRLRKARKT